MFRIFKKSKPADQSDEALLQQFQASGNTDVLGLLYERYMPMVYGVCLKILKDSMEAEDAVMSIYEELTKKAKKHKIESFRGWLYVLARNFCLMELRRKKRKPTDFVEADELARIGGSEAAFEYELPEGKSLLQQCLEGLAHLQKQCVTLFYYEDKSYKEISAAMGMELGKVRSYIQNGRRNLKICLETNGGR